MSAQIIYRALMRAAGVSVSDELTSNRMYVLSRGLYKQGVRVP